MSADIYISLGAIVAQTESTTTIRCNGSKHDLDAVETSVYAGLHFARPMESVLTMIRSKYGVMPENVFQAVLQKFGKQGIAVKFEPSNFGKLYPTKAGSFVKETPDHKFIMKNPNGKEQTLEAIYAAVWSQCDGKQSMSEIAQLIDEQKLPYSGEDAVRVCVPGLVAYGLATLDGVGGER